MNKFLLLILFFSLNLNAQTVYKTPSGSKYHMSSCRMVKNVSSGVSLSKAIELGLSPCKICKPPISSAYHLVSKPKKVNGVNSKISAKELPKREKDVNISRG